MYNKDIFCFIRYRTPTLCNLNPASHPLGRVHQSPGKAAKRWCGTVHAREEMVQIKIQIPVESGTDGGEIGTENEKSLGCVPGGAPTEWVKAFSGALRRAMRRSAGRGRGEGHSQGGGEAGGRLEFGGDGNRAGATERGGRAPPRGKLVIFGFGQRTGRAGRRYRRGCGFGTRCAVRRDVVLYSGQR